MGKPKALQSDTVSEIKAWINQPKNAAMAGGALVALLVISAIVARAKYGSAEAEAIAKAVEIATQRFEPAAQQFEATRQRFPASNGEIGLPGRNDRSWAPLVVAEVRADGTAYFEYANPRGGYDSNPTFQMRLRDGDGGKAGTCSAQRVMQSALEKNGQHCDNKDMSATPPPAPATEVVEAAPPPPPPGSDPAAPPPDMPVQPTHHLSVSRDVVQADHVIAAIDRDDAETLKQLKAQGAAICEPNPEGRLPIVEAARNGQMKALTFLIAVPCNLQQLEPFSQSTALISAISLRNTPATGALLAAGADPNFAPPGKPGPWQMLGDGEDMEIMQLRDALHARGVDINVVASDGSTLLIRAAGRGSSEMVRWLIGRGANLNVQDKRGRTAVMQAALNATPDSVKILQALIAARADLNLRDAGNYTVLGRVMLMTEDPVRQAEVRQLLQRAGAKG